MGIEETAVDIPATRRGSHYFRDSSAHLDLKFVDVGYTVQQRSLGDRIKGRPGSSKVILQHVTGSVSSGHVLAIIGPSGAGKTTCLDILALRLGHNDNSRSGSITIGDRPLTKQLFRRHCAYVPQEDRLWSALTVRENLEFAASFYMGTDFTVAERQERVDIVLRVLGLENCQHTKVGSVFVKGASGGQRRRTSIGTELIGGPDILFLDEPTSGLDSAAATSIMELLTDLAKESGLAVVSSIHQPSSRVFLAFDRVLLLSRGQVAYYGVANQVVPYFANIGYRCPEMTNPADYILDLANSDFGEVKIVEHILEEWKNSNENRQLKARTDAVAPYKEPRNLKGRHQFLHETVTHMKRISLNYQRDYSTYIARIMNYVIMSIFLGTTYVTISDVQSDIINRVYLVVWLTAFFSYSSGAVVPTFALEKAAVAKEASNGQYSLLSYTIAAGISRSVVVALLSIITVIPAYWITMMNESGTRFVLFTVYFFLFLNVVENFATFIGAAFKNFLAGIVTFNSLLSVLFVFNGVFITYDSMPKVWIWIHYIPPFKYSTELLLDVVFGNKEYSDYDQCLADQRNGSSTPCYGATGEQVLAGLGSQFVDPNVGGWVVILIAMALFFNILIHRSISSAVL